jgi:Flp pilus assembly protein protease CpaA
VIFLFRRGYVGGGICKLIAVAFLWHGFVGGLALVALSFVLLVLVTNVIVKVKGFEGDMPYLPFAMAASVLLETPYLLQGIRGS